MTRFPSFFLSATLLGVSLLLVTPASIGSCAPKANVSGSALSNAEKAFVRAFHAAIRAPDGSAKQRQGARDMAVVLRQSGQNVRAQVVNRSHGPNAPLHLAARLNDEELARLLLARGANPNLQPVTRSEATPFTHPSPLQVAARHNAFKVARLLVERGGNARLPSDLTSSALRLAVEGRFSLLALFLLGRTNLPNEERFSLLLVAVDTNNLPLANAVWKRVEVEKLDAQTGLSPLHVWVATDTNSSPWSVARRVKVLGFLARQGANLDTPDREGRTPLWSAIEHQETPDVAMALVRVGANVNSSVSGKSLFVHNADRSGGMALGNLLIARRAEVSVGADQGQAALQNLLEFYGGARAPETLYLLQGLQKLFGGKWPEFRFQNNRTLWEQAALRSPQVLRAVLQCGATIQTKGSARTAQLTPALGVAAANNSLENARLLLEAGADPNERGVNGLTPLLAQVQFSNLDVLVLLLDTVADKNQTDRNGDTVLHRAAIYNRPDFIPALLAKGVDANLKNKLGRTALQEATTRHKDAVVAAFSKAQRE